MSISLSSSALVNSEQNVQQVNFMKKSQSDPGDSMQTTQNSQLLVVKNSDSLISFFQKTAATVAVCSIDAVISPLIADFATSKFGFCLSKPLSKNSYDMITSISNPIAKLNRSIASLFGSNITSDVFIPALCEEVEFRWLLQRVILKEFPEKVLTPLSPNLAKCLDSMPARITRVALTALIFAYMHSNVLTCEAGGGLPQLIGGILYSGIYEFKDHSFNGLVDCINLHGLYNLLGYLSTTI